MSSNINTLARHLLNQNQDNRELHSPFMPEEILRGEPIRAEVVTNGVKRSYRVWRLSPLGLELLCNDSDSDIKPGDPMDVTVTLGVQPIHYRGLFVKSIQQDAKGKIIGIRLIEEKQSPPESRTEDRRKEKRWICDSEYLPTGIAPNPIRYGDYIYFKVRDISASGIQFSTSLRNKFILNGMILETMMTFPMVGQVSCKMKITNLRVVSEGPSEILIVGARVQDEFYGRFREVASQYLLQFGDIKTLREIKESNFSTARMGKSLDLKYVRTQEDYEKVLELRKKAYVLEGKVQPDAKTYDLATEYDPMARICMVMYRGQVIASAAIIFHTKQSTLEQEKYFEWTADYPDREDLIEVNRVCTDPDFRGSDALFALFRFIAIISIQSGRNYCIIGTTDKLAPLYDKLGFRNSGQSFLMPELGNQRHSMFIGNIVRGITGEGVNPIAWVLVYSDITDYLNEYLGHRFTFWQIVRMFFLRMLKPIVRKKLQSR